MGGRGKAYPLPTPITYVDDALKRVELYIAYREYYTHSDGRRDTWPGVSWLHIDLNLSNFDRNYLPPLPPTGKPVFTALLFYRVSLIYCMFVQIASDDVDEVHQY